MYDPETSALIRLTPQLDGLNVDDLPDMLSRAFAEIVAARVRLRTDTIGQEELPDIVNFARRLALTNEALVSLAPRREGRSAAAFVAATAHQLSFNALRMGVTAARETRLDPQSISSDIAAMLLFLVAEATADANEVADRIILPIERSVERSLIAALRVLARGRLKMILETRLISRTQIRHGTQSDTAASALYYTLLRGVRALATRLGSAAADPDDPIALFEHVRSLSVAESDGSEGLDGTGPLGAFWSPRAVVRAGDGADLGRPPASDRERHVRHPACRVADGALLPADAVLRATRRHVGAVGVVVCRGGCRLRPGHGEQARDDHGAGRGRAV